MTENTVNYLQPHDLGMKTLEIPNEKVTQIEFTKNRLFALTESGHVYVWILMIQKEDKLDEAE